MTTACLDPVVYRIGDRPGDSGTTAEADCPFPDHVSLTRSIGLTGLTHAYVPDRGPTVLALAHAEVALEAAGPAGDGWRSTDLFALALEATAMGCAAWPADALHSVSYPYDPTLEADGCFDVVETTTRTDFCRLWPASCRNSHEDQFSATSTHIGHFTRGVHLAAHTAVFVTAMLAAHGTEDPVGWLQTATDPAVRVKVLAIAWFDSPYSDHLDAVVAGCADRPVEDCISDEWLAGRVARVGSHATDLTEARSTGTCVQGPLTEAHLHEYLMGLVVLFPDEDYETLRDAGLPHLGSGVREAREVGRALEEARLTPLSCPTDLLQTWYGVPCP